MVCLHRRNGLNEETKSQRALRSALSRCGVWFGGGGQRRVGWDRFALRRRLAFRVA